ncbi:MAG TPA: DUF1573 domain-containing protein [Fimbriimonas sp.]|nr:DUF1573 domain-containing protein [Fimbriimonas sp.]
MLLALTLTLAMHQTSAPILSPGARTEMHDAVLQVERQLAKGDFEGAKESLNLLPKGEFTIGWDDSGLPPQLREKVAMCRDQAIQLWQRIQGLKAKVAPTGDLNISFVDKLPNGPQGIPLGVRITFGKNPRVAAEIGEHRGNPPQAIILQDYIQSIGRAIGTYLGVADDPLAGNVMFSDDRPALRLGGPSYAQLFTASGNLKAALQLQLLVQNKESVPITEPGAALSPLKGDLGTVLQGSLVPLEFNLSNPGTAPLIYNLVPDCGCFSHVPAGVLQPGQSAKLKTMVNTQEYTGTINKLLVLYTNDPKNPALQIPVTFRARPAFRLFRPEGDRIVVPDQGATIDVYLFSPKDSNLKPDRYEWDGIDGKVTMEKWQGVLADPEMGEAAMPRDGYRFQIKLSGNIPPGRPTGTLLIETGDAKFGELRYTINAQKGVIADPGFLILGDVVGNTRASFDVSRPGKPFRILSVTTGSPSLKAVVATGTAKDQYRIDVICDGTGPKGDFSSWIRLKLDDPKQPKLDVSVTGTID